jgi:chromosome segregation ATPase
VLHDQLTQTETSSQTKNSEIQGIAKECQDLEVEIARSNKLQAAAREEANALKRRANDLKDELATAVWALQETEAEEEQLRGQIISSPDRRTADVAKARDELDAVKAEAARFEEETELGKTSYRNLNKALKDVTSVMTNLDDLQKEYDRRTDLNRKLEETFKTVAVKKNEHKDLLEETQQADRDVSRTEEKISAQRKQHQVQIEALQDALETAKSQLLHVEKERREGMLRIQEWEAEVKRLEGAIEKERLETKQEMDRMTAEYKEYERGFLDMDRRRQELLAANSPLQ